MSILVGYLPSPEGEAALSAGIAEAKLRGLDLVILNSPRKGAAIDAAMASAEKVAELIKLAADAGVQATVRQPIHTDDLTDEFMDVADEISASLIVIGLRKRSQVGKFIMGSQAQRILLQADRPVLAVKAADSI